MGTSESLCVRPVVGSEPPGFQQSNYQGALIASCV
jgi:hypothetical protein